jgi:hypothetical protein
MEKVIKIGKQEVKLNNNVAWTMEYRDQFGKDILPVVLPMAATLMEGASSIINNGSSWDDVVGALEGRSMEILLPLMQTEFVDVVVNVTWAMAKTADENIEPPKQWVRQFDSFPLDVIIPNVYELIMKGFASSKNLKRLKEIGASLKKLQPSPQMTSSSLDSNED